MPRVKPTRMEEMNRQARAVLMDYLTVRGYKYAQDLAVFCNMSEKTARRRFEHPDELKISEMRQLKGLTDDQIIRMVRGKQ